MAGTKKHLNALLQDYHMSNLATYHIDRTTKYPTLGRPRSPLLPQPTEEEEMGSTASLQPKTETLTDPQKDRTIARETAARVNSWRTPSGNFFNITNPALRTQLPVNHLDGNLPFYTKAARQATQDPMSPTSAIDGNRSSPRDFFAPRSSPGNSRPSTASAPPASPLQSPKRGGNLRFASSYTGRASPLPPAASASGSPRVSTPGRAGTPSGAEPQVKSRDIITTFSF